MSKIPMFPNKFAIFASILGAMYNGTIDATGFDNIKTKGVWKVDTGGSGTTIWDTSGVLICIPLSESWVWQIKYSAEKKGVAQRYFTGREMDWTTWEVISTDIPSFYKDYSSLVALGSALGDAGKMRTFNGSFILGSEDLCIHNGWYLNWTSGIEGSAFLEVFSVDGTILQKMMNPANSDYCKVRLSQNSGQTWSAWKKYNMV